MQWCQENQVDTLSDCNNSQLISPHNKLCWCYLLPETPDITAHDEITQAFSIFICIREVSKYWKQKQGYTELTPVVQWACHTFDNSSYMCLCYPREPTYLSLQTPKLSNIWMLYEGCSAMSQFISSYRAARNTPFSITQYLHLNTLWIPCLLVFFSLDMLHAHNNSWLGFE